MSENREEILANFQGITAIEDVAEAIFHLEETNWDLLAAINRVMPQEVKAAAPTSPDDSHDVEMIDEDISVLTPRILPPDRADNNEASTSAYRSNSSSQIMLNVNYSNKMHEVKMPISATVSDLKKRIELVCGVPLCRQQLSGVGGSRATSAATLASLGLKSGDVLRLKAAEGSVHDDEVAERLTTTYTLKVKNEERDFTLKYPGTKTVQEVKNDIYSLTDIPVTHQAWIGWPEVSGLESTVLAMVGLRLPEHELSVRRAPPRQKEHKRLEAMAESSDSDVSSVGDLDDIGEVADTFPAEEDIFVDVRRGPPQPLMSESVEDEALGCIEFAARFRARYGPQTPRFYEGTLQGAIEEACLRPAAERKLLGVYLHHEGSVLSNVFCAQLLGCETVLQTLEENFLLYGWDLTHPDNNNMLLAAVANALGPVASMTVRSIPVERLPALVLIMRVRSNTEIYSVINGNVGVSELVGALMEAVERFAQAQSEDTRAEMEREARQKVKLEQDEAYRCSLEADRAKEESRRQLEMERSQQLQRAESERMREEAHREARRMSAEQRVPAEPAEGEGEAARLRVRLPPPRTDLLERRFRATDTVTALLDFLASKGYPKESYKVISCWPRKDLTAEPASRTLKELKLCPQETVIVEER